MLLRGPHRHNWLAAAMSPWSRLPARSHRPPCLSGSRKTSADVSAPAQPGPQWMHRAWSPLYQLMSAAWWVISAGPVRESSSAGGSAGSCDGVMIIYWHDWVTLVPPLTPPGHERGAAPLGPAPHPSSFLSSEIRGDWRENSGNWSNYR